MRITLRIEKITTVVSGVEENICQDTNWSEEGITTVVSGVKENNSKDKNKSQR